MKTFTLLYICTPRCRTVWGLNVANLYCTAHTCHHFTTTPTLHRHFTISPPLHHLATTSPPLHHHFTISPSLHHLASTSPSLHHFAITSAFRYHFISSPPLRHHCTISPSLHHFAVTSSPRLHFAITVPFRHHFAITSPFRHHFITSPPLRHHFTITSPFRHYFASTSPSLHHFATTSPSLHHHFTATPQFRRHFTTSPPLHHFASTSPPFHHFITNLFFHMSIPNIAFNFSRILLENYEQETLVLCSSGLMESLGSDFRRPYEARPLTASCLSFNFRQVTMVKKEWSLTSITELILIRACFCYFNRGQVGLSSTSVQTVRISPSTSTVIRCLVLSLPAAVQMSGYCCGNWYIHCH